MSDLDFPTAFVFGSMADTAIIAFSYIKKGINVENKRKDIEPGIKLCESLENGYKARLYNELKLSDSVDLTFFQTLTKGYSEDQKSSFVERVGRVKELARKMKDGYTPSEKEGKEYRDLFANVSIVLSK
jgi:hypothetical protein